MMDFMLRLKTFALIIVLALSSATQRAERAQSQSALDLLDEVWQVVHDNFYDAHFNGVDWQAARERCRLRIAGLTSRDEAAPQINAMLDELKASHTHLYVPGEVAYYELLDLFRVGVGDALKAIAPDGVVRYVGIGALVQSVDDGLLVTEVYEASPARKAGIMQGDVLVTIGDQKGEGATDTAPLRSLTQFRPYADQEVSVGVRRGQGNAVRTVRVTPREIVPHELFLESIRASARVIERDGKRLAYVRIRSYASQDYQDMLVELLSQEPLHSCDGLILDIRGGWGGANPEYLNLFNRDIPVMQSSTRDGHSVVIDRQWRKAVVLLVDHGTRSGKEVLTYAFKAHGIGKVVGTRTAGAVLGGRAFLLKDSSLLMVAVTDALVDGQRLEGVGVEPDVVVERGDIEHLGGADRQLERAVTVLTEELNK